VALVVAIDAQLEEVARGDIPAQYARVIGVSVSPSGRYAIVMLATNVGGAIEFDETVAERIDDRWVPVASGTPSSTVYVGDHRATILCNYADPLPPDVKRVVVSDRGDEREAPVENGYFIYAAWKQDTDGAPSTDPPMPKIVGTRES
jgi:hypothetical protein